MSWKIIKEDIQCSSFAEYAYTPAHMHIHTEECNEFTKGKPAPEDKVDIAK